MRMPLALTILVLSTASWPVAAAQSPRSNVTSRRAPLLGQRENRWRYVWHNDRWWFWTADEHWNYFDGRRWVEYDPRRAPSGRFAAAYRKAPAFEAPPAVPPRPPGSWPIEAVGIEAELLSPLTPGKNGVAGTTDARPSFRLGPATSVGGLRPSGEGATHGLPRVGGGTSNLRRGTIGGGSFGGPTGSSFGAGSAAGGASSPQ